MNEDYMNNFGNGNSNEDANTTGGTDATIIPQEDSSSTYSNEAERNTIPQGNSNTNSNGTTENTNQEPPRKKKKGGFKKVVALALCCSLIGGLVGAGVTVAISSQSKNSTTITTSSRTTSDVTVETVEAGEEMTAAEVYAQNVGATVGITTSTTTNYFGYETTSAASGSGFIISSDGYILTCYHVIEDSDSITVTMYDDTTYEAELIGYDENNDIAVLKIEATDLQAVVLGDSDTLSVGDGVVAIGNPLGELTFSLTSGVVSALNRSITTSSNITMNLIQTDCAINSGNSGGALFNMYGEVVGIVNAKYSSSSSSSSASIDNIGFAIPISQVTDIVTSIIETGTVETSYIGVTVSDVTMEAAAASGLTQGAVIQSVTEGAPADEAGLQVGDVITQAGGTEITESNDLVTVVQSSSVGDELVLTVNRSGETMEITVTVGAQSESALPESEETVSESSSEENSNSQSNGQGSNSFGNFSPNGQ